MLARQEWCEAWFRAWGFKVYRGFSRVVGGKSGVKGELWGFIGSKLLLGRGSRGLGALSIRFQSPECIRHLISQKSATVQIFTGHLLQNLAI